MFVEPFFAVYSFHNIRQKQKKSINMSPTSDQAGGNNYTVHDPWLSLALWRYSGGLLYKQPPEKETGTPPLEFLQHSLIEAI